MLKTSINIADWIVNGVTVIVLTSANKKDNIEYIKFNDNNFGIAEA